MLGIDNFLVFLITGILLNLYPGQDTFYIVGRSVSQGRMAGVFAVFGIVTGAFTHTIIGTVGLSAILLTSAKAFTVVKYAGAVYLFYQAILMIKESKIRKSEQLSNILKKDLFKIYKQGAITNILNPKVALFFMALIPQFISPSSPNKSLSFVLLGLVFITTGTIWCLCLAMFASYLSERLRKSSTISKWMLRVNAGLFVYLGIRLATVQIKTQGG
jgi:threonine/homoserine/homoserine lactone efflux protein